MGAMPLFRNDDVSFDTEMEFFPSFCDIFHRNGYRQVHAVTLYGLCNYAHRYNGVHCVYPNRPTLSSLPNGLIRKLSTPYCIKDNTELVRYLNKSPDEIALHGLFHTDYSAMSMAEQVEEMLAGLKLLHALFPGKAVRFFVPPFNRRNDATYAAANRCGLRVLGDEGVHLEEAVAADELVLDPGIWYRYHHHRFYPTTTYAAPALNLEHLDAVFAKARPGGPGDPLSIPSFDYEGDISLLERLCTEHKAQPWFVDVARVRYARKELALAMGWMYSRLPADARIFEVGCGSGNNLLWLSQHGYENLGGSDTDPKALAVAEGMMHSLNATWDLRQGSLLEPEHIPAPVDCVLAVNCTLYLAEFSLSEFLKGCGAKLSEHGCIVLDQVDASFNSHPCNAWHSAQWLLPEEQRDRPSEYRQRTALADMISAAEACGLRMAAAMPSLQAVPRWVYVLTPKDATVAARRPLPCLPLPEPMVQPTIEAIHRSGLFDWAWYHKTYMHASDAMNPLEHFVRFGATRGARPNPHFNTDAYRRVHMSLTDFTNPLMHALLYRGVNAEKF